MFVLWMLPYMLSCSQNDWHWMEKCVWPQCFFSLLFFYPPGLLETHEYTFHISDMRGNISAGYFRSIRLAKEPFHYKHNSWKCPMHCHIIMPSETGDDISNGWWHQACAQHWTFKPSRADSDLDFNSKLDHEYLNVSFHHGLPHPLGQHAYFQSYKCKHVVI